MSSHLYKSDGNQPLLAVSYTNTPSEFEAFKSAINLVKSSGDGGAGGAGGGGGGAGGPGGVGGAGGGAGGAGGGAGVAGQSPIPEHDLE